VSGFSVEGALLLWDLLFSSWTIGVLSRFGDLDYISSFENGRPCLQQRKRNRGRLGRPWGPTMSSFSLHRHSTTFFFFFGIGVKRPVKFGNGEAKVYLEKNVYTLKVIVNSASLSHHILFEIDNLEF
jgi:hypothetical protein